MVAARCRGRPGRRRGRRRPRPRRPRAASRRCRRRRCPCSVVHSASAVATPSTATAPNGSSRSRARAGEHGARDGRRGGDEDDDEPRRPDDAVRADVGDRRHEQREQRHASGDGAPGPGEGGEPPVVQDGQAGGEDGARAEEDDDGEAAGAVPQRLHEPPRDAGRDTDEERRGRPGRGSRGAALPAAQSPRRRGSKAGTCSDCAAWKMTAPAPRAASSRTAPTSGGETLRAARASPPARKASQSSDHGREAGGGGELVEVGGDQPDEADADEARHRARAARGRR